MELIIQLTIVKLKINYYLQIINSTTGAEGYSIVSTTSAASQPTAINVTTSGTGYTAVAYNGSTTVATVSGTTAGATGTKHGIVKAYSAAGQGTTVDNFTAQGQ